MIFSVFTVHKIQFILNLHSVKFSHHATASKYSHMSLLSSSTFLKGHTQYTDVCYVLKSKTHEKSWQSHVLHYIYKLTDQ